MIDSRNLFSYLKWCLYALAIIGVLLVAAVWSSRHYIRRGMTPAQLAAMDRFFESVEIPEEWQKVQPFAPEVMQAVHRFNRTGHLIDEVSSGYRELYDKIRAPEDSSPEWDEVAEAVRKAKPCTDALKSMVADPGYEMNALPPRKGSGPLPDTLRITRSVDTLCLDACYCEHAGDYGQAFEDCIAALRLIKRHPASPLTVHRVALVGQRLPCLTILRLAQECKDADVLDQALNDMNSLAPGLVLNLFDDKQIICVIGVLRAFSRLGYKVDLSPGKPLSYYYRQDLRIWRDVEPVYFPQAFPVRQSALEKAFHSTPIGIEYLYSRVVRHMGSERDVEIEIRINADFELTRLAVASRIEKLETGRRPVDVSALVPKYIPEPLSDPFADGPYRRDPERKTFYSIGPDGTDSSAKISYDPTNGTVSAGDIFLPGRTRPQGADMIR